MGKTSRIACATSGLAVLLAAGLASPVVAAAATSTTFTFTAVGGGAPTAGTIYLTSPDGRYILTGNGTTGMSWFDLQTGASRVLGVKPDGTRAFPGQSIYPYYHSAPETVPSFADAILYRTNSSFDIPQWREDLRTGEITPVTSWPPAEFQDVLPASCPSSTRSSLYIVKATTTEVYFNTTCGIDPADSGADTDGYIYDRVSGKYTLVTMPAEGTRVSSVSNGIAGVSTDGQVIAYTAATSVPGSWMKATQGVIWNRSTNVRTKVTWPNDSAYHGAATMSGISPDGRTALVKSYEPVPEGNNTVYTFYDAATGARHAIPALPGQAGQEVVYAVPSPNWKYVLVELANYDPVLYDLTRHTTEAITPQETSGWSWPRWVADDGNTALLISSRYDLVPGVGGRTDSGYDSAFIARRTITDKTPPTIATPGDQDLRATGPTGAVVTYPTVTAVDDVDGPIPVLCDHQPGETYPLGTTTVTCNATDKARNHTTATFTVHIGYRWDGFLQPITDTGHATAANASHFKAGSTVPVKFQAKYADGTIASLATAPSWLVPQRCGSAADPVDLAGCAALVPSGASYRLATDVWIYNWKTDHSMAGSYWKIAVQLADGSTHETLIDLQ